MKDWFLLENTICAPADVEESGVAMDEAAFQVFYRRTAGPLRAYVARVMGDASQADDIVQESYLRFLGSAPPTDDPQHFRAFLFRVAANLMGDYWRKQGASAAPRRRRGRPPARPARIFR